MKKINIRSFKVKVTLLLVATMLFSGAASNYLILSYTQKSQFNQLRDKLMIIASTAALMIDTDTLLQIPLSPRGPYYPQYESIAGKLKNILEVNPSLRYTYIMTKTDKEGVWQFIIDTKPVRGARKVKTALPGDKYDASRFPEMLKGFSSPSADKTLVADEWGNSLSGYAPIRDKLGKAVAVLGVDIMADDLYIIQKQVNRWVALILLFGVILSVALGMFISVKITSPVKKLVEGTRHIAAGNLQYQVEIRSADEIGELAKSFNNMAGSLYEARKKLREYFYGIVQSLVRTIEAKDRYTRGHSERVAEYAEKIAVGMGFSAEKAELLKEAAVLHDIGKLGIHEDILNKKEKLTDEEWEAIRKHPATGEDILKPVLGEEMLEAIKEHHERCDGTGYPNKLDADHISIFAKIIAVADTYDAMTSSRAYRAALSKKEAIVELKKGKGSQFDPQVVDVFVKVLEEET